MPHGETSKLYADLNLQRCNLRQQLVTGRQVAGGPLPSWDSVYDGLDEVQGHLRTARILED